MKTRYVLLVLACFVLLPQRSAEAQRFRARGGVGVMVYPQGMYIGAGAVGTTILRQDGGDELLEDGVGLTLFSGFRVNEQFALEGAWTGTLHNPASVDTPFGRDTDYLVMNSLTGDAKIFFPGQGQRIVPFVQGGVGLYLLDSQYFGTQSVGTGFQAGGGFELPLGPNVDIDLRALYRGIAMGPPDQNRSDTFISAVSADASIVIHF